MLRMSEDRPIDLAHWCSENAGANDSLLECLFIIEIAGDSITFARGRGEVLCPGNPTDLRRIRRAALLLANKDLSQSGAALSFIRGPASRLSCLRDDRFGLLGADQTLGQEGFGGLSHGRDVLAMILPRST